MSLPDQDVVARAQSIFERLRAEHQPPGGEGRPPDPPGETGAPPAAPGSVDEARRQAPEADDVVASGFFGEPPAAAAEAAGGAGGAAAAGRAGDPSLGAEEEETVGPAAPTGALEAPDALIVPPAPDTVSFAPDISVGGPAPPPLGPAESRPPAADPAPGPAPPTEDAAAAPRVVAIANQKGGVGKTTTAVNLGAALAELGLRVLVVDLDPQGNATTGLGINSRNLDQSIYDVLLRDVALDDCIEPTSLRNLFVAPATIELAGAEIELVPAFSRELRLRRAIDEVRDDFDYVLIDCPPSLGLLTVNGLAAADEVLVPIQCEYYALEGLGQLLRNVNLVQAKLNPRLEVSTIVLTMYDARTKLAEQVTREVRTHFGAKVCRNVVPRTVRLSEAPSFGQPVTLFDPTSRGSIAYRELAKEVHRGPSERAR